jgi:hypothetical protein
MFLPGYGTIAIADQTWVLASIGAVVEMGMLSTLKRLLMESSKAKARYTCVRFSGNDNATTTKNFVISRRTAPGQNFAVIVAGKKRTRVFSLKPSAYGR